MILRHPGPRYPMNDEAVKLLGHFREAHYVREDPDQQSLEALLRKCLDQSKTGPNQINVAQHLKSHASHSSGAWTQDVVASVERGAPVPVAGANANVKVTTTIDMRRSMANVCADMGKSQRVMA